MERRYKHGLGTSELEQICTYVDMIQLTATGDHVDDDCLILFVDIVDGG